MKTISYIEPSPSIEVIPSQKKMISKACSVFSQLFSAWKESHRKRAVALYQAENAFREIREENFLKYSHLMPRI